MPTLINLAPYLPAPGAAGSSSSVPPSSAGSTAGPAAGTLGALFQQLLSDVLGGASSAGSSPAPGAGNPPTQPSTTAPNGAANSDDDTEATKRSALAGLLLNSFSPQTLTQTLAGLAGTTDQTEAGGAATAATGDLPAGTALPQMLQASASPLLAALALEAEAAAPGQASQPLKAAANPPQQTFKSAEPPPQAGTTTPTSPESATRPTPLPVDLHALGPAATVHTQAAEAQVPSPSQTVLAADTTKPAEKSAGKPLAGLDMLGSAANTASAHNQELARLAEAPETPATRASAEDVVRQMAAAVSTAVKTGQTSLRVQLYPDDLGHIDLRVTTSAAGLHVALTADRPATASLLGQRMDDLQSALSRSGVSLAGLSVGTGGANGAASGWGANGQPHNATPGWAPANQPAQPAEDEVNQAGPAAYAPANGRVDYRI